MPEALNPISLIVAVGVVSHQGRFLITRRMPGASFAGYWEFPGGKVNPGESLKAALQRELQEELGIRVEVNVERMVIEHRYPKRTVRLHCFDCRLVEGEPRALECAEWRWVHPEGVNEFQFPPANLALVRALNKAASAQTL